MKNTYSVQRRGPHNGDRSSFAEFPQDRYYQGRTRRHRLLRPRFRPYLLVLQVQSANFFGDDVLKFRRYFLLLLRHLHRPLVYYHAVQHQPRSYQRRCSHAHCLPECFYFIIVDATTAHLYWLFGAAIIAIVTKASFDRRYLAVVERGWRSFLPF